MEKMQNVVVFWRLGKSSIGGHFFTLRKKKARALI